MKRNLDASGTNNYAYYAGGLLYTEGGLWASDVVTNVLFERMRTSLVPQQPSLTWANRFGRDASKRLTNVTSQAGSFTNEYFVGVDGACGYTNRLLFPKPQL